MTLDRSIAPAAVREPVAQFEGRVTEPGPEQLGLHRGHVAVATARHPRPAGVRKVAFTMVKCM
jgi:hypothetical protein